MTHVTKWYSQLMANPDDTTPIADAYEHYMEQYEEAREEADKLVSTKNEISRACAKLPGIAAYRFAQLQEIEQILEFLENREKRLKGIRRRHYREHYNRELNDSMVERYVEGDLDVLELVETRNTFALVRNKFLAITKQHEYLHFQLTNITRLKDKDIIDATFS